MGLGVQCDSRLRKLRMPQYCVVPGSIILEAAEGRLRVAAPPSVKPFGTEQLVMMRFSSGARRQADRGLRLGPRAAALGNVESSGQHGGAHAGGICVGKKFRGFFPAEAGQLVKR